MEDAGAERPASNGRTGAATVTHDGESKRTISHENGDHYRPYNIKMPPSIFQVSSSEYLGVERNFLQYTQRHDFARALLEEKEIRLGDATATRSALHRA